MSRLAIPVGPQDHAQGAADAPVTLVEYGDYQCPYCGQAYPVLKQVQEAMGDRLRFVFRNFPITQSHAHALDAARLAEAAAQAGRFWEAHDLLYENQDALSRHDLLDYAGQLGLDSAVVAEGFNGSHDERIEGDFEGGVRSGVNGTPTLFINGVRVDGPWDAESLILALERAADAR
jgi:protein-disulfide isomerase